ncbi:MAG TPA: hypothetical protein VM925_34960 [Labilithrix sp.]|nr:hypothetical protein [Labilithrix sp.]
MKRLLFMFITLSSLGCAVQTTTGGAWTAEQRPVWAVSAGGTMQALRKSNVVVGGRATSRIDDGFVLRSGVLHAGYDIVSEKTRLAIEPGVDIGLGGPVVSRYGGIGSYLGTNVNLRCRVAGGDQEPSYNIAFPFVEVVFSPRSGVWMPPEGSGNVRLYHDLGLEFGLRIGFGSDVASAAQGRSPSRVESSSPREDR